MTATDRLDTVSLVRPAISPDGPTIRLELTSDTSFANMYFDLEEAKNLVRELIDAVKWCEDHS